MQADGRGFDSPRLHVYSGMDLRIETLDMSRPADERKLQEIIAEGWEPFAVVPGPKSRREIWFKRLVLAD